MNSLPLSDDEPLIAQEEPKDPADATMKVLPAFVAFHVITASTFMAPSAVLSSHALRSAPIVASEQTLWHSVRTPLALAFLCYVLPAMSHSPCHASPTLHLQIRSAMKTQEECLVDAENAAEQSDCNEPIHKNPKWMRAQNRGSPSAAQISSMTVATVAPTPAFDEMIDAISVEECIVSAESREEQLECASRPKFASLGSPNPASYPSMRRGPIAVMRERLDEGRRLNLSRLGAVKDKFPSPWFPATIASTIAVGRAIARF